MSDYLLKRRLIAQGLKDPDPKKSDQKAKIKKAEDAKMLELDRAFYAEIWSASPHKCQECGAKLPKEAVNLFFHHMLHKSVRPDLRHTPENIAIVCPDCHSQLHSNADKCPKILARTKEVEKLFAF